MKRTGEFTELSAEYSRLRGLAKARTKRLQAAGFKGAPDFPLVKDVSSVRELRKELGKVQRWLAKPTSTVSGARKSAEEKRAKNRERVQRHRERMRNLTPSEKLALEKARALGFTKVTSANIKTYMNFSNVERGLFKSAAHFGMYLSPSEVKQFAAYLRYRESQAEASKFYRFDQWAEDFMDMKEAGISVTQLKKDYALFKTDQIALAEQAAQMEGAVTQLSFNQMFTDLIKTYKTAREG